MKINLTARLKQAITAELERVARDHAILDVYGVATRLQAEHPYENVAWEDIVQALLAGRGNIGAVEFAERAPEIVEIILPGPAMVAGEEIKIAAG